MIITFNPIAIAKINNFSVNKPFSTFVSFDKSIENEIETAYISTRKGVKTDTPLLPQWDKKYKQLYCKNSGWYFAYRPIRGGIRIFDAYHQTEMKDAKGNGEDITLNPEQDVSMLSNTFWTYVKDANYGFVIVKHGEFEYNYVDLNGDILIKDNHGLPIWFDNISPFHEGFLESLSAYGIKDGYIVFFYSNGRYHQTNILASKYGLTKYKLLESNHNISRTDFIITEAINNFLRRELIA